MAIDTRVNDVNWGQIKEDLTEELGIPYGLRPHGVAWLYAAVHRVRDGNVRKLIEFGNPDGKIVGQRERTMVVFAQTGLGVDDVLTIRQDDLPTTCRLVKSRLSDVIIVEWEAYHPAHANPEVFISRLISRLRSLTEQNP